MNKDELVKHIEEKGIRNYFLYFNNKAKKYLYLMDALSEFGKIKMQRVKTEGLNKKYPKVDFEQVRSIEGLANEISKEIDLETATEAQVKNLTKDLIRDLQKYDNLILERLEKSCKKAKRYV